HDHVIQRLFATGLGMEGMLRRVDGDDARRLAGYVEDLDVTIRDIRATIFALRGDGPGAAGLRRHVLDVVARAAGPLGFEPHVRLDGPIDAAVPPDVGDALLAVVNEALSNVTRHAHATDVAVLVAAGPADRLTVRVRDNGVGPSTPTRRSGLANLAERARRLGGTFRVHGEPGRGTLVEWRVPLTG
ncbi:MAG TPA: ATP-binding protein, partial [Frankiaceae bacterium]|nr:ATP-binding protein [Frankiaceae bacterium]